MWKTVGGGDGFYTAQDPEHPEIVYSESQGGSMGRVNTITGDRMSLPKPGGRGADPAGSKGGGAGQAGELAMELEHPHDSLPP